MKKSSISVLPQFYDRYINLAPDVEITTALEQNPFENDLELLEKYQNKAYAPEKWTINQIIRHCIDTERIMAYRALRFARQDKTSLVGFSENEYAEEAGKTLDFQKLIAEFETVRKSSQFLFKSFTPEMLIQNGTASTIEISVLSLGFVIVGHSMHHINVIQERYF